MSSIANVRNRATSHLPRRSELLLFPGTAIFLWAWALTSFVDILITSGVFGVYDLCSDTKGHNSTFITGYCIGSGLNFVSTLLLTTLYWLPVKDRLERERASGVLTDL